LIDKLLIALVEDVDIKRRYFLEFDNLLLYCLIKLFWGSEEECMCTFWGTCKD